MDNLLKLAIANHFGKDTKEFKATPGVHNVDQVVTLRIKGQVTKLADTTYTPTVDIPMLPTLALVLEKAGFQRELAKTLLIAAMTEALEVGAKGAETVAERVKDIETAMEHVREVTSKLPKKSKSGATTVKISIEEVEAIVVEQIDI